MRTIVFDFQSSLRTPGQRFVNTLVLLLALLLVSACGGTSSGSNNKDADAAIQPDLGGLDQSLPDTNVPDTNVEDSVLDTNVEDSVPDTNVADTNVADTNVADANVADANVADTNVADTNVADTNVADTNVADTSDSATPDAQQDTAQPDLGPADATADLGQDQTDQSSADQQDTAQSDTSDALQDLDDDQSTSDAGGDTTLPGNKLTQFLNHSSTNVDLLRYALKLKPATAGDLVAGKPYSTTEQVDAVKGVGPSTLVKLEAYANNWTPGVTDCLLSWLNNSSTTETTLTDAGVSEKVAKAIIDQRDTSQNPYDAKGELDAVAGVGPATIALLETSAGCGKLELLNSNSVAPLNDVAFFENGNALIVGNYQQGTANVLRFYEFNPDALTPDDDPHALYNLTSEVAAGMNFYSVDFTKSGTGILVGEGTTIYKYLAEGDVFSMLTADLGGIHNRVKTSGETALINNLDNQKLLQLGSTATKPGELLSGKLNDFAFTEGSSLILVGDSGAVQQWATSTLTPLTSGATEHLFAVFYHSTSQRALIVGDKGTLISYKDGSFERLASQTISVLKDVAISPDGTYAIAVGADATILRYTFSSGAIAFLTSSVNSDLEAVSFSKHSDPKNGFALIVGQKGVVLKFTP